MCKGKTIVNKKNNFSPILQSVLLSCLTAAGGSFLLFSFYAGTDDIISARESIILLSSAAGIAVTSFLIARKLSAKIIFLSFTLSLITAAAVNFEFPDLMKLPMQLPADNTVTIAEIEENASLSMTWAYRFRPSTLKTDPFLTNPDRDISFSQLIKTGTWDEILNDDDPVLMTHQQGVSLGLSEKFRTHLAVLCFKAADGTVTLRISGSREAITITPEMTAEQPYRIILRNGLLSELTGNAIQIFLWGGAFCFLYLCGIFLCNSAQKISEKYRHLLIFFCAFLAPCLIMTILCVFLKITPFGEKSFLINDMWGEYADYMAYFRTILSGDNDLLYSFSKSLGDDLLSLLAFYVINPLNWLVCLFKPTDLPLAVTVLVILRYGIAGLTAAIYFTKQRKCGFSALLFSTCYALMSFNILNAENTNLRESALVLPLVIMGLEQLIDGNSRRTYVWALACAIFLNFYSGYQICIFSAIYFLFYYFQKNRKETFFQTLWRFIFFSLLAVGICAFLLIPVVLQLRNGPKSFDPNILTFRINMPWQGLFGKMLVSAYDVEQFKAEGLPNLYIGLFCGMLLPLFFLDREISVKKRGLTAVMLICFIFIMQINPLNLALHGFNQPGWWPYRYSFIICFFLLGIAQESFTHRGRWHFSGICLTFICCALLIWRLSTANYGWMTADSLILNSVLLAGIYLLICLGFRRKNAHAAAILSIMTAIELFLNASHILTINTAYERSNTVNDYVSYYNENQPVINEIKNMDSGFYRIEKNHFRTANDPMLFNYNGITHYSSTLNKDVMNFLPRIGFRYYPYRFLYWEGSDTAMDSLLGIKYLISADEMFKPYSPVFEKNSYTVFENPYVLPIMFTASPAVMTSELAVKSDSFELQNQIFSALTGEDIIIFHPASSTGPAAKDLIYQDATPDMCWFSIKSDNDEPISGSLTWNITTKNSDTLYAFFPGTDIHPVTLRLNTKPFGRYFDNFSCHILRLGTFEAGNELALEMTPMEDRVCLNNAQFYHEDINALDKAVSSLREDKTELRKLTSSHLEGSFTASNDKVLFFTIPYNKGWTIRIDGQKVPVNKVLGTFMAVSVSPGTHSVDLQYIPIGLIPGVMISLLSILASIFYGRKKSRLSMQEK